MPMTDYAGQAISLMFGVSRIMRSKMTAGGKDHMNWAQIHALCAIEARDGITMKELAQILMVTAPTATAFVERLVRAKFVARATDPRNRKLVRLRITPAGARIVKTSVKHKQEHMRKFIATLPANDQRALVRILEKLLSYSSSSRLSS